LFQAIKLERALGVLKRDRASLESLVAHFNTSTRQAETGVERLRSAADGAGRQIEIQITKSASLRDDLAFMTERGERLADRLDTLVRAARPLVQDRPLANDRAAHSSDADAASGGSLIERNLLQTLRLAR
jgi:hypothetical protein